MSEKITKDQVEAEIARTQYIRVKGTTLTIAVLHCTSGLVVTGESACISMEDFNPKIGKDLAREDAFSKLWTAMGQAKVLNRGGFAKERAKRGAK